MYMGHTVHKLVPAVWEIHNDLVTGDVVAPLDPFTQPWPTTRRNPVLSMLPFLSSTTQEDPCNCFSNWKEIILYHPFLSHLTQMNWLSICCIQVWNVSLLGSWWNLPGTVVSLVDCRGRPLLGRDTLDVQGSDSVQLHRARKQTQESARFSVSSGHRQSNPLWSRSPFL